VIVCVPIISCMPTPFVYIVFHLLSNKQINVSPHSNYRCWEVRLIQ